MLHNEYGPRGAEEEHEPKELWVDLSETDPLAETTQTRRAPMASHNDPLGSWTGTPTMPALKTDTEEETDTDDDMPEPEIPTQDADDL